MKGRQLLFGSILDPKQLQVVYTAYDAAWEIIKPSVPKNPQAQEAARLKLANILLGLESGGALNVVQLRDRAVWLYRTSSDPWN